MDVADRGVVGGVGVSLDAPVRELDARYRALAARL